MRTFMMSLYLLKLLFDFPSIFSAGGKVVYFNIYVVMEIANAITRNRPVNRTGDPHTPECKSQINKDDCRE